MRNIYSLLLLCIAINTFGQAPKILVEDYTGAWCGWCPYGALETETLEKNFPGKICTIANHMSDAYKTDDGYSVIQELQIFSFPSITMNRHLWKTPNDSDLLLYPATSNYQLEDMSPNVIYLLGTTTPCTVSIENVIYNSISKQLTATVSTKFLKQFSGDIRLNILLTEDSILTYNEQKNYGHTIYSSPFYGDGDPIPVYYQNNVLREMLGGPWGTQGIIPASVVVNSTYSKTYTLNLSSSYNFKQIKLIGLVQSYNQNDYTKRDVLNCEIGKITDLTSGIKTETASLFNVTVSPNPVISNYCKINLTLEQSENVSIDIYNVIGEKVATVLNEFTATGLYSFNWQSNVPAGVYYIQTTIAGEKLVKKVIVNK